MAKDARVPVRLPSALKDEFEWAAGQDGARGVSTWLRQLGEERAEELRAAAKPAISFTEAIELQRRRNGAIRQQNERVHTEPVSAFVPGYGLDEED